jgi:hypothetical protein
MPLIPFLLAPMYISSDLVHKYNDLKTLEDPDFTPLELYGSTKKIQRADYLWASIMPPPRTILIKNKSDAWDCRYVMIDEKYVPYVNISEYDGSETYSIDYNKYAMDKIKAIIEESVWDQLKVLAIQEILEELEKVDHH